MAFSLNKIMLIGALGQDSETRFSTNNTAITTFSIATSYSYKDKSGEWKEETTWHNIVGFNLSDFFRDGLKKGRKVYVEGRLNKKDYVDKEGVKRYSTDVIIEKLIPLDPQNKGTAQNSSASDPAEDEDTSLPF